MMVFIARSALGLFPCCTLTLVAGLSMAQDGEESTAAQIAKELANPNATLGFLAFPVDFVRNGGDLPGATDQSSWRVNFQPSFPYPLSASTNLFVRPLVPVFVDQPIPVVGDQAVGGSLGNFDKTGLQLGDISFDVAVGRTFGSGLVTIGGLVGTLPTATDDRVGVGQFLLGPEFLIGQGFGWGFVGALITHQWNVAGDDDFSTSITGGQYFYTIHLNDGWQLQGQPTFSYNHNGAEGSKLTLPIGIGLSKTAVLGGGIWKFSTQYWHYIEAPEAFGPKYQIRFQVIKVVSLPW